jgi:hypothetical protein
VTQPPLRAGAIIEVLNRHGVRYVVIGAYAAIAQQAPIRATRDIDVTPDSSADNLERLSTALKELGARIRTDRFPEGLPFDHDGRSLGASSVWNLICDDGELDISFRPSGFASGYAELGPNAHLVRVESVDVMVADLQDVIRSKEAAGRPTSRCFRPSTGLFVTGRSVVPPKTATLALTETGDGAQKGVSRSLLLGRRGISLDGPRG